MTPGTCRWDRVEYYTLRAEGADKSEGSRTEDGRAWRVSRVKGCCIHDARVGREEGRPRMT